MKHLCRFHGVLLLLAAAFATHSTPASAQNCGNYDRVVGWHGHFNQTANGTATSGSAVFTVDESAASDVVLKLLMRPSCAAPGPVLQWYAVPLTGLGGFLNPALSITNDNVVGTCPPPVGGTQTLTVTLASGSTLSSFSNAFLNIDFGAKQYYFYAGPVTPATFVDSGCPGGGGSTTDVPNFAFYYPPPPPSPYSLTLPDATPSLGGSAKFGASAAPSPLPIPWTLGFTLTPVFDDQVDRPCKSLRKSTLGCQNQTLAEDVPIVGTPLWLHYQSDRVAGRASADPASTAYAKMLGGWTLNIHHFYDGKLFLGDGQMRSEWQLSPPTANGSNLLVTSEDGTEIYVFDSTTGLHLRTLTALRGAVLYQFGYDVAGNLTSVTDGSGNVTTIQRDSAENATAIVSPFGQTTTLLLDTNGYLSAIADPLGQTAKFSYDPTGLMQSHTDPRGLTSTYSFDVLGRVTQDTDPTTAPTLFTRTDSLNLLTTLTRAPSFYSVTQTTPLGRATGYRVDLLPKSGEGSGNSSTVTLPDGLTTSDSTTQTGGQIVRNVGLPDGTSLQSSSSPDPRWGLQAPVIQSGTFTQGSLSMTLGGGRTVALASASDPFSVVTQTDTRTVNGRTYTSAFAATSSAIVDTSPMGRTNTVTLDALERVTATQVSGLAAMRYTYDTRGRLVTVTQANHQVSLSYDANGFLNSITDRLGRKHAFTYDAAGRMLTHTAPDGGVTQYTYDADDNLTSLTPPGGGAHTFNYSLTNQLSAYMPAMVAGTGATNYVYDSDGALSTVNRPGGDTITYSYDGAGRPSSISAPSATIGLAYDSTSGNLASATRSGGPALTYSYNGPLRTQTSLTGTVKGSVGRTYDNNFRVTTASINGANNVAITYDDDGAPTQVGALTITNSAVNSLITGTSLGLAADARNYDSLGELTGYTAAFSGAPLYSVLLKRDLIGRVSGKTETIAGVTVNYAYQYDIGGRLTGAYQNGTLVRTYSYDANSNRTGSRGPSGTVTASYDAQDRLVSYGGNSYTFSPNGELASKTAASQTTTYAYDDFGNLTSVSLPGGTVITYLVDAENRRVGRLVNGTLTAGFLYDNDHIVAQLDGSNAILSQFVYGTSTTPDYMIRSGATYRIFSDQLGSPRLVINSATGAIAERIDYDEFGNVINDTNPGLIPFGFGGGLYDPDTQLVHFGARDYDPGTGRWTAKDPILFGGSDSNVYSYIMNDPVNLTDPTGLDPQDCRACKVRDFAGGFVDEYVNLQSDVAMGPWKYLINWLGGSGQGVLGVAGDVVLGNTGLATRNLTGVAQSVDPGSWSYFFGGRAVDAASSVGELLLTSGERAAAQAARTAAQESFEKAVARGRGVRKCSLRGYKGGDYYDSGRHIR
jgi:RHS repeat-associated protein